MTLNGYSDEQLRLAARVYYVDGLDQSEVARFTKVSRAKVSRLLAAARERGLVRKLGLEYEPRNLELERILTKKFNLSAVAVIKTISTSVEDTRRVVGYFGAPFVAAQLPQKSVVAIAGGRTIRQLIQHLPEDHARHLTVVQAMGSIDSVVGPEDALELGSALARCSGGHFLSLNSPAFVTDRTIRDALHALPQIRSVRDHFTKANVAIVGVGTLTNSVFAARRVITAQDIKELTRCGAVGEICGRFYDKNGVECDSPLRDRVLSIELKHIRQIQRVIGVVASGDRSAAITAAIRGGLLKALVIDDTAASYLCANAPTVGGGKRKALATS